MQISTEQIIIIVLLLTIMSLIVVGFIISYVRLFNERKRKYQEEKAQMEEQFQIELLQSKLEIQEQTFNDISKELHDNVGQLLSLASLQLGMSKLQNTPNVIADEDIKKNIDDALYQLRNIAKSLNGDFIQHFSIAEFLENIKKQLDALNTVKMTIHQKGGNTSMPISQKIVLIRVLQECIQNIIKHANAHSISVHIDNTQSGICKVSLQDDGQGFEMQILDQHKGLGIMNMQKRIQMMNGTFDLDTSIGRGTTIQIAVPVNEKINQ